MIIHNDLNPQTMVIFGALLPDDVFWGFCLTFKDLIIDRMIKE
jgi:hypothetical protein